MQNATKDFTKVGVRVRTVRVCVSAIYTVIDLNGISLVRNKAPLILTPCLATLPLQQLLTDTQDQLNQIKQVIFYMTLSLSLARGF